MAITHSVFFRLKHGTGSGEEKEFFRKSLDILVPIPGVKDFQVLKQTSTKADFDFGFSMVFENEEAYQAYNNHPDHVRYVEQIWLKEVDSFQEIDHQPLPGF